MMKRSRTWMSVLAALAVGGCSARGQTDLLESRLRRQEDAIAELRIELRQARSELEIARHESRTLRDQLAGRGEQGILPEQVETLYRASGIQLNRWFTGSIDRDGQPGDELLTAVVAPVDADGQLVKLPGAIRLELLDLSKREGEQRIGVWEFDVDESRRHWHQGFFNAGYFFKLPWQQPPESERLLLHARLTTIDGRQFDTTQEIRITPPRFIRGDQDLPADPPPLRPVSNESDREPLYIEHDDEVPVERPVPIPTSDRWTEQTMPRLR